jgi:phage N-6-adenine-methyltransferase
VREASQSFEGFAALISLIVERDLVKYYAAREALAEAHRVDEVKRIRDEATQWKAYAQQAKDRQLIGYATGIRLRAERRIGQLMQAQREAVGLSKGGGTGANQYRAAGLRKNPAANPTLADAGIDKNLAHRARKLSKLDDELFETKVTETISRAQAAIEGKKHQPRAVPGDNEWSTPQQYLDAARAVLGGIDLDPATNLFAQSRVRAAKFFTIEDDGLREAWQGRVWLNPPYGPQIAHFVSKLVREVKKGNVTAAIMLTHNNTDTEWFHKAARTSAAICFGRGRIQFEQSDDRVRTATQGQAFFYFGTNVEGFHKVFGKIGLIVTPWAPITASDTMSVTDGHDDGIAFLRAAE